MKFKRNVVYFSADNVLAMYAEDNTHCIDRWIFETEDQRSYVFRNASSKILIMVSKEEESGWHKGLFYLPDTEEDLVEKLTVKIQKKITSGGRTNPRLATYMVNDALNELGIMVVPSMTDYISLGLDKEIIEWLRSNCGGE